MLAAVARDARASVPALGHPARRSGRGMCISERRSGATDSAIQVPRPAAANDCLGPESIVQVQPGQIGALRLDLTLRALHQQCPKMRDTTASGDESLDKSCALSEGGRSYHSTATCTSGSARACGRCSFISMIRCITNPNRCHRIRIPRAWLEHESAVSMCPDRRTLTHGAPARSESIGAHAADKLRRDSWTRCGIASWPASRSHAQPASHFAKQGCSVCH
jgi:hypothetical protein